jgi:putative resolvase
MMFLYTLKEYFKLKLSEYAKEIGISYTTAWRHFKAGKIPYPTHKLPSGTIIVDYDRRLKSCKTRIAAIYIRTNKETDKSENHSQYLLDYAIKKGYEVKYIIKEVAERLDDCNELWNLLNKSDYDIFIVEDRSQLFYFGITFLELFLRGSNKTLDIVNQIEQKDSLILDLIITIMDFLTKSFNTDNFKQKIEKIIAIIRDC